MVTKNKRGGYIGSFSSYSQKQMHEGDISSTKTLANIVAKEENSDYVLKNFSIHIRYIEQEDFHLLDDPWAIRSKYFTPFQTPSYADKFIIYYEAFINQIDSININHTIKKSFKCI